MSDVGLSYHRMCLRLERYFRSMDKVDTLPIAPPGWHRYVELVQNVIGQKDGMKQFESGTEDGVGTKADGTRINTSCYSLSHIAKPETLFCLEAIAFSTMSNQDLHVNDISNMTDQYNFNLQPEAIHFATGYRGKKPESGFSLRLYELTMGEKKRNASDFLLWQNFTVLPKRPRSETNLLHEIVDGTSSMDKVPCQTIFYAHLLKFLRQGDISWLRQAASILSNSPLFCLIVSKKANVGDALPKDIVKSILEKYYSQRMESLRNLCTFKDIHHFVKLECNKILNDPISVMFWDMSKSNKQFSPPDQIPDGLFVSNLQYNDYSQLAIGVKQKKMKLYMLSDELQYYNGLNLLTGKMTKAVDDCYHSISSSKKSIALRSALEVRVDIEELLESKSAD